MIQVDFGLKKSTIIKCEYHLTLKYSIFFYCINVTIVLYLNQYYNAQCCIAIIFLCSYAWKTFSNCKWPEWMEPTTTTTKLKKNSKKRFWWQKFFIYVFVYLKGGSSVTTHSIALMVQLISYPQVILFNLNTFETIGVCCRLDISHSMSFKPTKQDAVNVVHSVFFMSFIIDRYNSALNCITLTSATWRSEPWMLNYINNSTFSIKCYEHFFKISITHILRHEQTDQKWQAVLYLTLYICYLDTYCINFESLVQVFKRIKMFHSRKKKNDNQ